MGRTLPVEFTNLSKLEYLYLGKNSLMNKRDDVEPLLLIAQLTELKELFLFHNVLTSLPAEFGDLKQMTKFSAANNKIKKIPGRMGGWDELEELYLSHNEIVSLPVSFGAFRKLKEFQIAFNPLLETLPKGM